MRGLPTIISKLNTPSKVQDFLDRMPFNFEENGKTCMSPLRAWRSKKMHCFEGALFASFCLKQHGIENYLVDLKVKKSAVADSDHILCAFKINGYWGAISKTNHSVLRWRDPIYKNIRELAFSYYHEYFLDDGEKTLKSYSRPFNIWKRFGTKWVVQTEDLDKIAEAIDGSPHANFVPKQNRKLIRNAGKTEIKGAMAIEWQRHRKDDRMKK